MHRVLIAGGSIGGLTTGVLLRELGYDVEIFERSSAELQERGTGIVVLPITERYFTERASAKRSDEIETVSLQLTDWSYIDASGQLVATDHDRFRFSGWSTIYRALLASFEPARYHLDSEMAGFDQTGDGVVLRLADVRREDVGLESKA